MYEKLYQISTTPNLIEFYSIVALISFLYSSILVLLINYYTKKEKLQLLLFFVMVDLVTLFVGFIFTTIITSILIRFKSKKYIYDVKSINYDEFKVEFHNIKRIFGEGSLQQLLRDEKAPKDFKLKALSTISENTSRENIALIKNTLSDSVDEIRLYGFSIIDSIEKKINSRIKKKLEQLKKTKDDNEKIVIYTSIINQYWDLLYFDLSDKSLQKFLLKKIKKFAKEALEISDKNPNLYITLGKAFMFENNLQLARKAFTKAIINGADGNFIKPYLAEIAFKNRKFANVSKILNSAENLEENITLYPVVAQWKNI